jgi:DNA-binding ferritin-like protein
MPCDIVEMLQESEITLDPIEGDSDALFEQVLGDLEVLKGCTEELMETAEEEEHKEIANYAQDRILALAKFEWMIKSTLS